MINTGLLIINEGKAKMKKWIIFGYWLTCVWGIGVAHAKSAEEAEYERLVSEMTKFSKTQSWHGVNKRFSEMEKLGIEIGVEELLLAADLSRHWKYLSG